ncbi:MAG: hypothetical protein WDZ49_06420 [Litorilinea sp.]
MDRILLPPLLDPAQRDPDETGDNNEADSTNRGVDAPDHDVSEEAAARRALRLAADRRKIWPGEWRVLAVRFLDGNPAIQARVAAVAQEWTRFANIRFEFNNAPGAPIRISFTPGASWSLIGTDALDSRIEPDAPTMNFGWLTPATPQDELQRVVLHEFGHALGLIHEHQNPDAAIPWDKDVVYQYYAGPPNHWSRTQVDVNIFERYAAEVVNASEFDPQSIMLYPIPQEFTRGAYSVGWNRTLSTTDQEHIARVYPPSP